MGRVWAGLAGAAALVTAGAGNSACTLVKLAELPVTMWEMSPTVHAKINGAEVRLIADSGGFYSIITPGRAAEFKLKLRPGPSWFLIKGLGGMVQPSWTTVKAFTLDTIPLENIDFIVGGGEFGAENAGMLGRNVLGYADTEYDLANGVIRLMDPRGCAGHALAYWAGGKAYSVLDMVASSEIFPPAVVTVEVNGVKLRALFDTGATVSIIGRSAAARAGIPTDGPGVAKSGATRGVGRRMVGMVIAPVASVKIGDEEIKNTHMRVVDTAMDFEEDMLLGADFFLSHRIFIARGQNRVYFTYNGGPVFNLTATPIETAGSAASAAGPIGAEPNDAAAFSRRGEAFAGRRDFPHALADLDRAVELAPTNADYAYQRAILHLQAGQPFPAMADLDQTLKLRPGYAPALLARAELRLSGGHPNEAVRDLEDAAATLPHPADDHLRLGFVYQRADREDLAVPQFDLWIAAHPDDARRGQALNGRCWARAMLGRDLDKALADCDAAHRTDVKEASFLDSRGLVRLRLGDLDKAIADYDAALALQPKLAWSLYGRGLARQKKGLAADGAADIAAAVALRSDIAGLARRHGVTGDGS